MKGIIYKKLNDFNAFYRLRIFLARHTFLYYVSRLILLQGWYSQMERISHAARINIYISHLRNTELTFSKSHRARFSIIFYIDIFNVITRQYFQLFAQSIFQRYSWRSKKRANFFSKYARDYSCHSCIIYSHV